MSAGTLSRGPAALASCAAILLCGPLGCGGSARVDERIHKAARHGDDRTVARLLKSGVSVEALDEGGWTPLLWAAARGKASTVEVLLSAGANRGAVTRKESQDALTLAAKLNRAKVVSVLLRRGAAVQRRDSIGWTALMWSSLKGRTDVVKVLLDGGARVETTDSEGNTPLILAARQGRADTVRVLLDHGARVRAKNREGESAESLAREAGYPDIADLLRHRGGG